MSYYGRKVYMIPLFSKLRKSRALIGLKGAASLIFISMKAKKLSRQSRRRINKLEAIGRDGTINQDFGRTTYEYEIEGELYAEPITIEGLIGTSEEGRPLREVGQSIRGLTDQMIQNVIEYCFIGKIPILLSSDIDTTLVIIEEENLVQDATRPYGLFYRLKLLEISEVRPEERIIRRAIYNGTRGVAQTTTGIFSRLLKGRIVT